MLNPNNNRLDYGELLSAPAGYRLSFAIGTTYSLDLDALTGASLALGLSAETDSDLMKNPICLLEALRTTGDKVALFCEAGQIHLPGQVSSLYILLEKMVWQVKTEKTAAIAGYPAFHPKVWLLRYENNGKYLFRFAVMSRNLTFDRSWDVSFCMDGRMTSNPTEKNRPLQDFVTYLLTQLNTGRKTPDQKTKIKTMTEIRDQLATVEFQLEDRTFEDFTFLPTGIPKADGGTYSIADTRLFRGFVRDNMKENPCGGQNDGLHEIFVMSPFVSDGVINYFYNRSNYIRDARLMLITRASSLSKLKQVYFDRFAVYCLRDKAAFGESNISEEGSGPVQKQDIHAKLYLTRKGSDTDLYLGSLNATHNAVFGNVEFMICLHGKNRNINMKILTQDLFCGEDGGDNDPFERVNRMDGTATEEEDAQTDLDRIVKMICRLNPSAVIRPNGELYDVTLSFSGRKDSFEGVQVFVRPLLANKKQPFTREILFTSLNIMDLSEFYVVEVSDGERTISRVIKVPTAGMPENREKEVITSVVSDKTCFYRYIAFLLGDSFVLTALETGAQGQGTASQSNHGAAQMIPALYEKMLRTAASDPDRFGEIDALMRSISKDGIIPDDFAQVYETFKKAVSRK